MLFATKLSYFGYLLYFLNKKAFRCCIYTNRVVLLGDSCHATLPYVGQGANQAIEDAVCLAECLRRYDNHIQAFGSYYRQRFPRAKRIVNAAERLHKIYHTKNFLVKGLLNYGLAKVMQGGVIYKQLENEILYFFFKFELLTALCTK